VKKLPESAPEAPETALSFSRSARAYCRGHKSILTQNEADYRKPDARTCSPGSGNLNNGTVDGLETTKRCSIVSNYRWA
jgi:hypothetical protein